MAHDREVLRIVWEGQIPVCFQADPEEVVGLQQPENFYLMVSRLSYLPLVIDKVRKYFTRYISNESQDGDIWFDCNGTPLKLHYPIGLLYDLTHREEEGLPWYITIHFSRFPEEILVRFPNRDVLESHFMSCLKEADVLKHRGQVVSSMQKKDHNQLWQGLVNDKFDQFWAVNRRLMEPVSDQEHFKHIPIRFYYDDGTYHQKLISPVNEDGQKRIVQNLLQDLSTSGQQAERNKQFMISPGRIVYSFIVSWVLVILFDLRRLFAVTVKLKTHGIEIHEDTPLQWMSEHLSYPDNFLHLLVTYVNA